MDIGALYKGLQRLLWANSKRARGLAPAYCAWSFPRSLCLVNLKILPIFNSQSINHVHIPRAPSYSMQVLGCWAFLFLPFRFLRFHSGVIKPNIDILSKKYMLFPEGLLNSLEYGLLWALRSPRGMLRCNGA